jgi:hypothetical protein
MSKNRQQRRQEAAKAKTPPIDPLKIYMNAERFRIADQLLRTDAVLTEHGSSIGSPILVMATFASELYLKCLFTIETARPPIQSHELRKLFLQLSQPARDKIETQWNLFSTSPARVQHYEALEVARARLVRPRDSQLVRTGNTPASERQRMIRRPPHIEL